MRPRELRTEIAFPYVPTVGGVRERPFAVPIVFRRRLIRGWHVLQTKNEEDLELLQARLSAAALCISQRGLTDSWSARLPEGFPPTALTGPSAQLAALFAILAERAPLQPAVAAAGFILVTGSLDGETVLRVDNSSFSEKLRLLEDGTMIFVAPRDNWDALGHEVRERPALATIPCWRPVELFHAVRREAPDLPRRLVVTVGSDELPLLLGGLFKLTADSGLRLPKTEGLARETSNDVPIEASAPSLRANSDPPMLDAPANDAKPSGEATANQPTRGHTSRRLVSLAVLLVAVSIVAIAASSISVGTQRALGPRASGARAHDASAVRHPLVPIPLAGANSSDDAGPAIRPPSRPDAGSGLSGRTLSNASPERPNLTASGVVPVRLPSGRWEFQRVEDGHVIHCRGFMLAPMIENQAHLRATALRQERQRGVDCPIIPSHAVTQQPHSGR